MDLGLSRSMPRDEGESFSWHIFHGSNVRDVGRREHGQRLWYVPSSPGITSITRLVKSPCGAFRVPWAPRLSNAKKDSDLHWVVRFEEQMRGEGKTTRCDGKDSNHATTGQDRSRWRPFSTWPVLLGTTDHTWVLSASLQGSPFCSVAS